MQPNLQEFNSAVEAALASHLTKIQPSLVLESGLSELSLRVGLLLDSRKMIDSLALQHTNATAAGKVYGSEIRREFIYELQRIIDILKAVETQEKERPFEN